METFENLYSRLAKASISNQLFSEIESVKKDEKYNKYHLDCLLNPRKYPAVIRTGECNCSSDEKSPCQLSCLFNAITKDDNSNVTISKDDCTGCRACIENCDYKVLNEIKELIPLMEMLNKRETPVYAMIAPAYIGQFSQEVTPGKLRNAFKMLGFEGMLEVALFADILTLKEALEFDKHINNEKDFLLTSCCCPIWIAMIRKIYNKLIPHVPPSVSPMVACARSIKTLHPGAKTVFIGPCVAKKAEAREKDIADDVDIVLTFQETEELFKLAGINPAELDEDLRDHSSTAGRMYARTGGVSKAVENTLDRLRPDKEIKLKSQQADGVPACKELLNQIMSGEIKANFMEGMGCRGGCVGGPKAILKVEDGRKNVDEYSEEAFFKTPVDNTFVLELLHRLGFERISDLISDDNIFTRKFS